MADAALYSIYISLVTISVRQRLSPVICKYSVDEAQSRERVSVHYYLLELYRMSLPMTVVGSFGITAWADKGSVQIERVNGTKKI